MKKFKFTMQSLYNVKIALEKQQKVELEEANMRLAAFEAQLYAMHRQVDEQRVEFKAKVEKGINSAQMTVYAIGFRALQERIKRQEEKIAAAEAEKRRIQTKLVETMRERKMLESLREKQLEEYKAECRLEDNKAIEDFMASQIHKEKR